MRIHEQSTISSNEPKSYMTGKSNVSKHTTETFQTSQVRGRQRSGMNFCLKRILAVMISGRCSKISDFENTSNLIYICIIIIELLYICIIGKFLY